MSDLVLGVLASVSEDMPPFMGVTVILWNRETGTCQGGSITSSGEEIEPAEVTASMWAVLRRLLKPGGFAPSVTLCNHDHDHPGPSDA